MTTPTTNMRSAVRARLVAGVRAQSTGADVLYTFPRDGELTVATIFFGRITGEMENTVMTAGRTIRKDLFTIDAWAYVHADGDEDGRAADERCAALIAGVENYVAVNRHLEHGGSALPGVIWATTTGPMEGPNPEPTDTGHQAYASVPIRVFCRME